MYDFIKNNKATSLYWLKQPLQDLKFTIALKPQESIILLPKFEDKINESDEEVIRNETAMQEFTFRWQEKVFSQYEFQRFGDIQNCVSESDLSFNSAIQQLNKRPQKVFTYINEDYALPLPVIDKMGYEKGLFNLSSCFERLNFESIGNMLQSSSTSTHNLFKSEENIANVGEWTSMHIFYDNSKYDEDTLIYRDECLLLSLHHHTKYNYLMISPDINNESNAYLVECASGLLDLEYLVDVDFGETDCREELKDLLNKFLTKWEKKQKRVLNFVMPPLGQRKYYISFEIESAMNFDADNIYIEFHVKIPENMGCENNPNGRTHVTRPLVNEDTHVWMYGHIVDLELEVATGIGPPPLKIFFEVISIDRWQRRRSEGYSYLPLSLLPGSYKQSLSCSRPEELNEIDAKSRRFFVGGYHLIEDLEVLEKPQLYTTNFRFVSTGKISVHWTTISQSHSRISHSSEHSPIPHSSNSDLLQGADRVLKQYRRAKATLAKATRSFRDSVDSE